MKDKHTLIENYKLTIAQNAEYCRRRREQIRRKKREDFIVNICVIAAPAIVLLMMELQIILGG